MKTLIVGLLALVLCSGCSTYRGSKALSLYSPSELHLSIKQGDSTKKDVRSLLGDPLRVEIREGELTWCYSCRQNKMVFPFPGPVPVGRASLWIEFKGDIVSRVEYRGRIDIQEKEDADTESGPAIGTK